MTPKQPSLIDYHEGLTFDDFLIVPQYSDVLPSEVILKSRLTKKIHLEIPIVSADMDTVTEHKLAVALALEGGLGIIHKNLPPDEQAGEVKLVKRYKGAFIQDPITLRPDDLIQRAIDIKKKHGYDNIPVTQDGKPKGVLVGMLTNEDYSSRHAKLKVKQRMKPYKKLVTGIKGITIDQVRKKLEEHKVGRLLIIDNEKSHHLVSLVTKSDIEKKESYPLATEDQEKRLMVGAAVGPSADLEERVEKLIKAGVDALAVSTAHGHSAGVIKTVKWIKNKYNVEVIAGNVVAEEGALALIEAGADCVKVGVGPGSICTTRVVAGVGVPQMTAIMNCVKAARRYNVPLMADGGMRYSGDMAKALAVGADTLMLGSLLAGVEESAGEKIYFEGKTYKSYRGMGSEGALNEGSKERYAIEEDKRIVAQGIEGRVSYRGTCAEHVYQLVGGLRFAFGYVGAKDLPEFKKKVKLMRIGANSYVEGHPHDIIITKEASNYWKMKEGK